MSELKFGYPPEPIRGDPRALRRSAAAGLISQFEAASRTVLETLFDVMGESLVARVKSPRLSLAEALSHMSGAPGGIRNRRPGMHRGTDEMQSWQRVCEGGSFGVSAPPVPSQAV